MISTEKAFDLLPLISDIYEKTNVKEFIKETLEKNKEKKVEATTENQMLAGLDIFSYIMKKSALVKEEIFEILSIVEDKTIEEVRSRNVIETFKKLKELMANEDLIDFFRGAME